MKKPMPNLSAMLLVDRFRLMVVGVFLSFVLGGVLAPSAAKASFDFSVNLDSAVCGFQCTGTLFFTFDGTHVTFDTEKLLNAQIDTPWNSYLLAPSSVSALYPSSLNSGGMDLRTPYHLEPSWVQYTRLQVQIESPSMFIYTGPLNPDTSFVGCINCGFGGTSILSSQFLSAAPINPARFDFFDLRFTESIAGAGGDGYLEVSGAWTLNVVPQASGVPEPSSMLLLGAGLAGLVLWRWKHAA